MTLVRLPSGARAPLEAPGLLPLLTGGGSVLAVARATLAHDEVDASALSEEDAFCVALWGLDAFAASPEAVTLAMACEAYREAPARRCGITDPALAWALDSGCLLTLKEARIAASREPEDEPSKEAFTFSVPDEWSDDD